MNTLQSTLAQFTGTEQYYSLKPLSHLALTDGAKYLNDITPLVQDAAIVATHEPRVRKESFLSITINVNGQDVSTTIDDGNENIVYKQSYFGSDLEDGQYKLYATGGVLMLASEY